MIIPPDQLQTILLKSGLIDKKKFDEVSKYSVDTGLPIEEVLIDKGVADEKLGKLIAGYYKTPFIILAKTSIPDDIIHIIPERIAKVNKIIAWGRDENGLKIATDNPTNLTILQLLARKTGQKINVYYATRRDVDNTLFIYRRDLQKAVDQLLKEDVGSTKKVLLEDPPVAKIVDLLVETAYQEKASDIHIEPSEESSLVRYRIDGVLHDVVTASRLLHDRMMTRIKVLSRLRTDEHLSAQDGKMQTQLEQENLDIRVSIIPIADGEKAVLRLLSSKSRQYSLASLGMQENDLKKVDAAYRRSYGMILSTGPTGSGKTTSIYSILKVINTREKNITTVEDPIEYRMPGANQVQVNPKTNLTFASGLRSILRQDPNVIFVGEIRDGETAGIAVNAALTGHLVFSTLHTNDAATAIPRLIDMKVEPYLVASTVNIIIAQRLLRQICEMCKTPIQLSQVEMLKNFPAEIVKRYFGSGKQVTMYHGKGCKICHNTGYSGRIGIFEVLEVTRDLRKLITTKSDADVIMTQARKEGMKTMLEDGLEKVAKGLTTLEEVLRVTKAEFL